MLHHGRRRLALAHPNRKQLDPRLRLPKSSRPIEPTPTKHLISVHTVRSRYTRHRCARRQRLFDDTTLLSDTSLLPLRTDRTLFVFGNNCYLLASVHLCSKWTPVPSVHFAEWLSLRRLSRRPSANAYALPNFEVEIAKGFFEPRFILRLRISTNIVRYRESTRFVRKIAWASSRPRAGIAMAVRICLAHRIISNIPVEIEGLWVTEHCIGHRDRPSRPVRRHEAPKTRGVIPGTEVVETALSVAFFAGKLVVVQ